ncbi:hypothetical protein Tco_1054447 [Tanacetum coccineum]|uniref:Zinc finger, CCHC-type, retrotransposon Gag domain protein n=1 Tax=Tanacetum coccineum TaxID=301880 RepID=A0ABQ5GWT3_9ASTR
MPSLSRYGYSVLSVRTLFLFMIHPQNCYASPFFMSFAMILYMFDFMTYSIARAIYTHDHDLHDLPPSHGGYHDRGLMRAPVSRLFRLRSELSRGSLFMLPDYSSVGPLLFRGVWMVNTRTDAELAAAVQAAVTAMLPQIREQVREEYRNGASGSGGNPPPVTIHTWLERFNKQKPRTFEKAVTPVDAENWISHLEKIFDVMGCDDVFKAS